MELTDEQFKAIEPHLPTQLGNVKIGNMTVINALLFMMYEGCTWRGLPSVAFRLLAHDLHALAAQVEERVWCRVFRTLQETGALPSDATYFSFVQLAFIAITLRRLRVNTP